MDRRPTVLAALLTGLAFAGAAAGEEAAAPKITGTVAYRERIALPPDAVVHVRLEAAPQPERQPRLVAEVAVPAEGRQVPIPFELAYKASDIQPQQKYLVRATITAGDKTLFASRSSYPVITKGAPVKLEIQVEQSGGAHRPRPTPAPASPGADLTGTSWNLVRLGENPALALPGGRAAGIVFEAVQKRISGSTGCNRFMGTYAPAERGALKLEPAGMTLMACPDDVSAQEKAFLDALRATTGYRIDGGRLDLTAGDRVLAVFEAAASGAGTARSE